MKERMINEDIIQMRKLFRLKCEGKITQAELEGRVDAIIGRQITLLPSVGEKVSGIRCQVSGQTLKPKTWNLKPEIEAVK